MINKPKNNWSLLILLLILLVVVLYPILVQFHNPFRWDGFGYYLYLPMTIVHQDLGISDYSIIEQVQQRQFVSEAIYQIYPTDRGHYLIRYPAGLAILLAPFYALGHIVVLFFGMEADGFSLPYQIAVVVGCVFYICMGCIFLRKVMLHYFSDKITALTLVLVFFGTNILHQSIDGATGSHPLIFSIYAVILWLTLRWHKKPTLPNSILLGLSIGLITICRPTEIISVLIPVLYGVTSISSFWSKILFQFQQNRKLIMVSVLTGFLVVFIQMLYWKTYTGHFIYNSYNNPGEGLDLLSPHIFNSLFSFRKGWFVYTPLMLIAILGLYFTKKRSPELFVPLLFFVVINIYLVSSWTNWWYAYGFGQRAYAQSYAVLSLPLGFLVLAVWQMKGLKKWLWSSMLVFFLGLNLFQIIQYKSGVYPGDGITWAYYKAAFGKLNFSLQDHKHLLLFDRETPFEQAIKDRKYSKKLLWTNSFENETDNFSSLARSGQKSLLLDSNAPFSSAFKIAYKDIKTRDYVWLEVSFWAYVQDQNSQVYAVSLVERGDKLYGYETNDFLQNKSGIKFNQWQKYTIRYLPPHIRSKTDLLTNYFWFVSGSRVCIDVVEIHAYIPEKN